MKMFQEKLKQLEARSRLRSLNSASGIDLTSNDYLGLAGSDLLRAAAVAFFRNGGDIGAGGSRLLRGHGPAHAELEAFAAEFFAAQKALFFANGFQANLALFTALPDRRDTIIFDALIHASARDGIQASPAQHKRVQHNDLNAYEDALREAAGRGGQSWIAVESVYSMGGDFAPLAELYALAGRYDAVLVVDEAHATGVWGGGGKGLAHDLYADGGQPENLITLHTCGKAIGVAGGLVCASGAIIDYLINAARPFIYSTAPMPLQAHLVQQSLGLIGGTEGQARRERLFSLIHAAQKLFDGAGSQVVPIVIGEDALAVHVAKILQQKGYDIRAIRPPTVPEGTARLRLSLSAALEEEVLEDFAAVLTPLLREQAA